MNTGLFRKFALQALQQRLEWLDVTAGQERVIVVDWTGQQEKAVLLDDSADETVKLA